MALGAGWVPFVAAVGGVVAVGLPDEVRVVVGSHSGLGVFDASTGARTLRVATEAYEWLNAGGTEILLDNGEDGVEVISCMGLWGGGSLPLSTPDGWQCRRTSAGAVLARGGDSFEVSDDDEFRASGFSPAGQVFVFATSSSLTVLRRNL